MLLQVGNCATGVPVRVQRKFKGESDTSHWYRFDGLFTVVRRWLHRQAWPQGAQRPARGCPAQHVPLLHSTPLNDRLAARMAQLCASRSAHLLLTHVGTSPGPGFAPVQTVRRLHA